MSDIGHLVERLIEAGLSVGEASEIIATAVAAGAASAAYRKSPGALRQQRYRQRHKASQSVTPLRGDEASQSVTNRNETVTRDAASLSIEEKVDHNKKKRESAKAVQLPTDWRPDPESWTESEIILGSPDRAEYELKKFKDHALEKGRVAKNWNAAWRNWAKRAVEYGGRNGHGPSNNRTSSTAGPPPTGADTILAGLGRLASRVAERQLAERQQGLDLAGGDGADGSATVNGQPAYRGVG